VARTLEVDICVIGAGSGGLSVAAGASQMGANTVPFERGRMGGDCLNYGCVPSKALLAAAHAAQDARDAGRFGVSATPAIDFAAVRAHVDGVIDGIAPMDSVERFERLGVTVIRQSAHFASPREVVADDGSRVAAKFIVIATGSSPAAPPIPGLDAVPYFTNETVFDNPDLPEHLIVVGGGPIGLEMAQAHRRLGSRVTVLEAFTMLGKDDPELAGIVRERLAHEGIDLREGVGIDRVEGGNGVNAVLEDGARVNGSHLLVAAGRQPNVDGLELGAAGIATSAQGIQVDARLRTTNKRVFAVGDAAGGPQFTHIAGYHAGIVIRNALFRMPAKVNYRALPWVTFTDPELAQVGLTEAQARERHGTIRILRWPFAENDRAQTERTPHGFAKVITSRRGRILGAGLVGPHAGELLQPWCLAISRGLKIGSMAGVVVPYPTLGEVNKRAAGSFYTQALFSERTRRIVRFLLRFA